MLDPRDIRFDKIPSEMKLRPQWVLWKNITRDGMPTKVPFKHDGTMAKANDPSTWGGFPFALKAFREGDYTGIGFEFDVDDPYVGIDLDGCRDPETGRLAPWAREIVERFKTYTEVSPSSTGVKLFCRGALPGNNGRKKIIADAEKLSDKTPAIEMYSMGRYFAVTGWRLQGAFDPKIAQNAIDELIEQYWPAQETPTHRDYYSTDRVVERARKYMQRVPPSVSGSGGHNAAFYAACVLCLGFALDERDSRALLDEWNLTCTPPWSERELDHKIKQAMKQGGERGYLRNARPERWDSIDVPRHEEPKVSKKKRRERTADDIDTEMTVDGAAVKYLDSVAAGEIILIETGIPDLDYALGGGLAKGEMVVFAGRPSHGKSAAALQCIHNWTFSGMNGLLVSEEMSLFQIGKRSIQFISGVPQEHWDNSLPQLRGEVQTYSDQRAKCYIAESCRTANNVADVVERMVEKRKIEFIVVDYMGLIRGEGKSRVEQISDTSTMLTGLAKDFNILVLVQAQLNRDIEKRNVWKPTMSDLRDTGQIEADAKVIVATCWPHRIDPKNPPHEYDFVILKNANRPILQPGVRVHFDPARQTFSNPKIENHPRFDKSLAAWNRGEVDFEQLQEPDFN